MSAQAIFLLHIDPIENAKAYSDRYLTTGIKNGAAILCLIAKNLDYVITRETSRGTVVTSSVKPLGLPPPRPARYSDPIFILDGSYASRNNIKYTYGLLYNAFMQARGIAIERDPELQKASRNAFIGVYWMTLFLKQMCHEYSLAYGRVHSLRDYILELSTGLLKYLIKSNNPEILLIKERIYKEGLTKEILKEMFVYPLHEVDKIDLYIAGSKIRYLSSKPSYLTYGPNRQKVELTNGIPLGKLKKAEKLRRLTLEGKLDPIIEKLDIDLHNVLETPNLQEKVEKVFYNVLRIRFEYLREQNVTDPRHMLNIFSFVKSKEEPAIEHEIKRRTSEYLCSLPEDELLIASIFTHYSLHVFLVSLNNGPPPRRESFVRISVMSSDRQTLRRDDLEHLTSTISVLAAIGMNPTDELLQYSAKRLAEGWVQITTKAKLFASLSTEWKTRIKAYVDGRQTALRCIFPIRFNEYIPSDIFSEYLERYIKPKCQTSTSPSPTLPSPPTSETGVIHLSPNSDIFWATL